MKTFPELHTNRLKLRGILNSDLNLMIQYLNNKNISEQIVNIPYPYREEHAKIRFKFITKGFEDLDRFVFVITEKENDNLIGQIGLHLDKENNKAEIGYWIAEPYWGKGIASESLSAIIPFGFEELNLNKIFATHYVDNPASGKVLINNKMIKEAELKEHYKKGSGYESVFQYRLTKQEYENRF